MHRPRSAAFRRRILTVGLPALWFFALLGFVSTWATEGGRKGKTISGFLQDLPDLSLWPLAALLAVVTLACLTLHAAYPWLLQQRLVAAIGPPGEDTPVPMTYRFDDAGITQTSADLEAFLPWHLIKGLDEDRLHLFVLTDVEGEPIVLAKADLTTAQADGVRAWTAAGRPLSPHPPDDTDPFADEAGDAVRIAFTLTAEDRAALVTRTLDRPAMRRARMRGAVLLFVGLSLLVPGIVAFVWAVDPYRVPFSIAFPLFLEMAGTDFLKPAIGAAAVVLLVLALGPWNRRWAARELGRDLAREARPGTSYAHADARGLSVAQGGAWARLGWTNFRGCERLGELIVLPMRWGSVLPLPTRAFDPDALARFEALAARHLPSDGGPL
ncbi:YcxB family protein [Methylobacterium sp. 88A]|uniref:YcxB family protein n=1 Tax=Methylobacterium sp. 88A TaxID=1131813 RepID=UPI00036B07A9|nr:YcxB family protein [Methylobacterium sp. 88A]